MSPEFTKPKTGDKVYAISSCSVQCAHACTCDNIRNDV